MSARTTCCRCSRSSPWSSRVTHDADDIRDARAALIESLVPMTPGEVADGTFRAQVEGFREIAGVSADSETESYFQLRTRMTGPRWAGVGVTMEAGKWMGEACKRIVVTFRHPEQCLCGGVEHVANKIVFTMEPNDQIEICFFAKRVGLRGRGRGASVHVLPL